MPKSKEPKVENDFLKNALKELDSLAPKKEPEVRQVLPAAGKASVPKKKLAKAVSKKKEPKVAKPKAVVKPKKAPVKVKRVDEEDVIEMTSKTNLILVNPPSPVTEAEKQEDFPGKTKVVVKDGVVIVQLDE